MGKWVDAHSLSSTGNTKQFEWSKEFDTRRKQLHASSWGALDDIHEVVLSHNRPPTLKVHSHPIIPLTCH